MTKSGNDILFYVIAGVKRRDRSNDQAVNNGSPLSSAHSVSKPEKLPDAGIILDYDYDEHSRGFIEKKEILGAKQRMIFFSLIYLIMISNPLTMMMDGMMLVLISLFSLFYTKNTSRFPPTNKRRVKNFQSN